jgi:hypothetical protein
MSSGRLFLDRVARQQSPSPLHRYRQINTHAAEAQAKDDISTLPARRHFYFALTAVRLSLSQQSEKFLLAQSEKFLLTTGKMAGWKRKLYC